MILFETSCAAIPGACSDTRRALFDRVNDLKLPARCAQAIQLIFSEISGNLLRHTSALQTLIDVRLELEASSLKLQIQDNGPAFEEFTRYWNQAAATELSPFMETGRGLALIAPLVSHVDYRAGTPNRFSATVKLYAARPKILLAEDSAPLLAIYEAILRPVYDVLTASSLAEAVILARGEPVDAIVADFHLGDGKGTTLIDVLDENDARPPAPILIITGDHDPALRTDALRRGVDQLLVKPVKAPELRAAVAQTLERSARQNARAFRYFSGEAEREGRISADLTLEGYNAGVLNGAAALGCGDFLLQMSVAGGKRLILADVMGHGLGAQTAGAVFAAMLRTAHVLKPGSPPGDFLRTISKIMHDEPPVRDRLMTLLVADVLETGEISMAAAGHPRPLLARAGAAQPVLLQGPLPSLFVDFDYSTVRFKLASGERLLLLTDGISTTEADSGINPPEWLGTTLISHQKNDFGTVFSALKLALEQKIPERSQDDWTLVVIEKTD